MPNSLTPESISQMRQQLMMNLAQRQQGWGQQRDSGWLQNLAQSRWNNVGQQAQQQPWLQGIQNWLGRSPSQMGAQTPSWLGGMPWGQGAQQQPGGQMGNWMNGLWGQQQQQQGGVNPALALAGNGLGSTNVGNTSTDRPSIPSGILNNPNSTNRGATARSSFDY